MCAGEAIVSSRRNSYNQISTPRALQVTSRCVQQVFWLDLGSSPGLGAGGMIGVLPTSGVGAFIPGSISGGLISDRWANRVGGPRHGA